jgi:murein DD-endopeptidase MepM/ murein hydrolase activator NlpD
MSLGIGGGATSILNNRNQIVSSNNSKEDLINQMNNSDDNMDYATKINESENVAGIYYNEEQDKINLDDLKSELAEIDAILTEQNNKMEKLKTDVDNKMDYSPSIPNMWPAKGPISCPYGWRSNPFTHKGSEFHDGIDIAAPYGTPIKAASSGIVVFSGYKASWGKLVIISHGNGYVSQYAHNSSLLVKKGDKVKQGQVISRLGNTGRSTGPHVHFGVAKNGIWINPLKVLN